MKELHLVCNAHIDPVWQWEWEEGIASAISTFQSAVDLTKEFDYIFCHNEVILYKYIEEFAPELFTKIQDLVKKGVWHIMGGWYLQPDCNMPSGESFVRQIGYGRQYFSEKFGVKPTTAINFDSFGHSRGLVQILKKTGYDSYLFTRPNNTQMKLSDNQFIWKGFDGSEIKGVRQPEYNSLLGQARKKIEGYMSWNSVERENNPKPNEISMMLWGVGNHGGGPSREDLRDIKALQEESSIKIIHSTPEEFFKKINPTLTVESSLVDSNPGCYTSMSNIKMKHRQLENELYATEKISTIAYLSGLIEYPTNTIKSACEDLMTAQFHDILPGTSIEKGEKNGIRIMEHGLEELSRAKSKAFFRLISGQKRAEKGEYPIFVFNFQPFDVDDTVEVEFMLENQNWDDNTVALIEVYKNGNLISSQQIKEDSTLNLDWRKKVVFDCKLNALSLNRFDIKTKLIKKEEIINKQNFSYEDKNKKIVIDEKTGLLKSYIIGGEEMLKDGFGLFAYDDSADPWAMSDQETLNKVGSNPKAFRLMTEKESGEFCGLNNKTNRPINVIEDGKILKIIESYFIYNNSYAKIEYKIYKNHNYLDINLEIINNEKNKLIRLHVPPTIKGNFLGDTVFGINNLSENGKENVAQKFIAVSGEKVFAILNNGCYACSKEDDVLKHTLIRSTGYCFHPILDRDLYPQDRYLPRLDQGKNNFSFRILVDENIEKVFTNAQIFNERPYALNIFPTDSQKISHAKIELSNNQIVLVTAKKCDTEDKIIFRLQNNSEKPSNTVLKVNNDSFAINFGKFEVKTISYLNGSFTEEKEMII